MSYNYFDFILVKWWQLLVSQLLLSVTLILTSDRRVGAIIVVCTIVAKLNFWKIWSGRLVRCYKKFILKKLIMFMKLKKVNVVCAPEFSWFTKKVVCTSYSVLAVLVLIVSAIFGEIKFLANLKHQTFLHVFIKTLY